MAERAKSESDRYRKAWRRLRIGWVVGYGGWLLVVPTVAALPLLPDLSPVPYWLLFVGLLILGGSHTVHWFNCPRCQNNFWGHPRFRVIPTLLLRSCHHCGLRRGAVGSREDVPSSPPPTEPQK
jgi:hypothetical protein